MWQKVFQYFLRRFQITRGRSPMTPAEMNQIQSEAVNWINKTGGKTLPGTSQSQKPPFQGFTPRVIEGGKGKAGIGTLLKDSPEAIAKIKAENKAAIERLKAKKKTVEDFKDVGDFDPGGMASGGIAGPLHLYDGGRAGFKKGGFDPSKRKFLKGAGFGLGALSMLPFVGKFFKAAKPISKAAAPVVETIARGADGIPNYVYDLIDVVKAKGTKEIMEGVYKRNPPSVKYNYKGVEVVDDGTGGISVNKQQTKTGSWTDQATDDVIVDDYVDREIGFEIRKGDEYMDPNDYDKSFQHPDEYNESTAYMQGDPEGGLDVSDIVEKIDDADHAELKKIADESLIKKAKGGRASYTKGGLAHVLGV